MDRRRFIATAGATSAVGLSGCLENLGIGEGSDEDFPSGDIRNLVGYDPGGGADLYARGFNEALEEELGQTITIENEGGAGALNAAGETRTADSDGHHIGTHAPPLELMSQLELEPGFDFTELTGIAPMGTLVFTLSTHEDHEVEDLDDLISRYEDEEFVTMGGSEGLVELVLIPEIADALDIEVRSVSYGGSGPVIEAIQAQEIDVGVVSDSGAIAAIDSALEVVVALGDAGSPIFPDIPSITDLGYPSLGPITNLWLAIFGPPDMPDDVVDTWVDAIEAAAESEQMQEWSEETGNPIVVEPNGQEFDQEIDEMMEIIQDLA